MGGIKRRRKYLERMAEDNRKAMKRSEFREEHPDEEYESDEDIFKKSDGWKVYLKYKDIKEKQEELLDYEEFERRCVEDLDDDDDVSKEVSAASDLITGLKCEGGYINDTNDTSLNRTALLRKAKIKELEKKKNDSIRSSNSAPELSDKAKRFFKLNKKTIDKAIKLAKISESPEPSTSTNTKKMANKRELNKRSMDKTRDIRSAKTSKSPKPNISLIHTKKNEKVNDDPNKWIKLSRKTLDTS